MLTYIFAYLILSLLGVMLHCVFAEVDDPRSITSSDADLSWWQRPLPMFLFGGTVFLLLTLWVLEKVDTYYQSAEYGNELTLWRCFKLPAVWAIRCLFKGNTGDMGVLTGIED